jgi:predicted RNase H-like HicB family nuclease
MENSITLRIKSIGDEGYVVRSDQVSGLFAHGRTLDEAVKNAHEVLDALVESCEAHGDPCPIALAEPKIIEKRIPVPAC